jgi:N-acetylneuraminic acid mutarotase
VTGSMAQARWGHTATVLADGRVLVTGGVAGLGCSGATVCGNGRQLASAELFDPGNGRWAAAGSMHKIRSGHTATLLPDGRVVVAGGYDIKAAEVAGAEIMGLTAAELYDPNSGQWIMTGSMTDTRAGATATLRQDGRVLVAGGDVGGAGAGRSAELYDPGTGRWAITGSMADARRNHAATLLPDGRVLVTGGFAGSDFAGTPCSGVPGPCSAELYDPSHGRWTATGSMHAHRVGHTANLLTDGTVLVVGLGTDREPASTELYDPSTGRWTATASPAKTRGLTATLLLDGGVLATGDFSDNSRVAERYEPGVGR